MSYLHVTIKTKNSNCWLCIFKDLSVSELNRNLIKPYRLGKDIYYDGKILSPNDITQVRIIKTECEHEKELKVLQEESYKKVQEFNCINQSLVRISAGDGYSDSEINKCGKDLTNSYISSGPGVGTSFTAVAEFIKHPWVVRVVGGLVLFALIRYFWG